MEPEVQVHILNNLMELNRSVATIAQGQVDTGKRLDLFGPWARNIEEKHTEISDKVAEIEKWQTVTSWKIGSIAAGAGAVCSFACQWAAVKLGFKLR